VLGWKLSTCDNCSRSCRRQRLLWPTAGWARIMRLVLGTIIIMALSSFASLVGLCRLKLGVACPGNVASEKSRSGNTEQRQWGHCTLSRSHSSIHAEWKLWAHGRPRTCHVQTQLGALLVLRLLSIFLQSCNKLSPQSYCKVLVACCPPPPHPVTLWFLSFMILSAPHQQVLHVPMYWHHSVFNQVNWGTNLCVYFKLIQTDWACAELIHDTLETKFG
jgi:hypothetical protein